ncbi:MAG TPA: amidohydrolase family protein [Terriglobia bacterium]|nr:amidohydrolase family protein [Terriglobia bacterium]
MTRRKALIGTFATGALIGSRAGFGKASQPITSVKFDLPVKSCDCHTHIFDPLHFPYSPHRTYTPEAALPEEMAALHRALHVERVVIVTPSVYGTDNSATLFGITARGSSARGVAVIDERTKESELDTMAGAGVRGVRFNLVTTGGIDLGAARRQVTRANHRIKRHNWHIQIYARPEVISSLRGLIQDLSVPVVFDHFGGMQADLGIEQPGFVDLVELVASGKAYVKLSAAYRASKRGPDYPDVVPFAKALIAANEERVLWGTDWPHPGTTPPPGGQRTDVTPLLQIDDGRLLNQFAVWAPDPAVRQKILVDNRARLYGF